MGTAKDTFINESFKKKPYTMEYYSAIKRNEILPFVATWMDMEIIVLSEVNQTGKEKYHILLTCRM